MSFETILVDVSKKLDCLESNISQLSANVSSLHSEVKQNNRNICLLDRKLDRLAAQFTNSQQASTEMDEKSRNNLSSLLSNECSENLWHENGCSRITVCKNETHLDQNIGPGMNPQQKQRKLSIVLTPEEANKRARVQRINSRLLLFNPKKITIEYVRKHLSHPTLRRILWKDLLRVIFGIEEYQPERGIQGSKLIHPSSNFNTCHETVSILLLICTVVIVPLQLSFWNSDDICAGGGLLYFNMTVDAFFLFDLFYHFFVGVMLPGGFYVHDLGRVAQLYLRAPSGFFFNLVTSIPFGWVDWAFELAYCSGGDMSGNNYAQRMAFARAVKPIRALKLIRLLRVSGVWSNLLIKLDLPPIFFRAFKTMCLIIITLHLSTCGYWRLKVEHAHTHSRDNLRSGSFTTLPFTFSALAALTL